MNSLIVAIRSALADGATDDERASGANACRTILTVLEAKPGEPLVLPTETPSSSASVPMPASGPGQVAAIVGALRDVPPEQLLDLAIARLRAALPKDAEVPAAAPVRFQIIPLAPLATMVGGADRRTR